MAADACPRPAPVEVALAGREDLPRILEIANWAAVHTAANFATEPEPLAMWAAAFDETSRMYPWLVARSAGAVLGFAKAAPHRPRGAFAWTATVTVYVDPDQTRRGVGKALYARLIPALRAQGYVTLIAGITSPNPPSERLHAAFGFARCGTFHRAGWKLGAWHDCGYWELHLQPEGAPPGPIRPVAEVW